MLYACEGTKARVDKRYNRLNYSIELTNSNPNIIKTFRIFLDKIIKIDKNRIKGQLFFYPDLSEKKLIKFWSKKSSIPISQFNKSICLKAKIGKFRANPLGTFKIRYSCKNDFLKIQQIIEDTWKGVRAAE
ncbi:MAG: hypothetical protein COX45_02210 [Candidatus Portnoybacteria bacterium CG23_combo_of_CG06-09_8_20_14_all_44_36]|nr:MAG: hypothetical protein COX45_02210 [Candidatus Portnoybacteria bacterium CG23_combo_of_CG06-09_8_20_14_all_44_36]